MRNRLTYANVMVTLLAIGALTGGVAYAANTVGSTDIINESIQSVDLKNNQVQSVDVRNESLHSEDIGNLEIRSNNLGLNAVGPAQLDSNTVSSAIYQRQGVTATDSTQTKELQVSCALGRPDDKVVSGGYVVANTDAYVLRSYAVDSRTWLVRAKSVSAGASWQLTVIATCAA